MTIIDVMEDPALLGGHFDGVSWSAWKAALAALFALPLDAETLATYQRHTGRTVAPTAAFREAYFICGRRAGKSRISALVAVYLAVFRDWTAHLAAGERGVISLLAADRKQASLVELHRGTDRLADALEDGRLAWRGVDRTLEPRGHRSSHVIVSRRSRYTLIAVIADELAFWRETRRARIPTPK